MNTYVNVVQLRQRAQNMTTRNKDRDRVTCRDGSELGAARPTPRDGRGHFALAISRCKASHLSTCSRDITGALCSGPNTQTSKFG